MPSPNPALDLAEQFVLHTRQSLFLTGRAGTGKTTFLRNILKKTTKNHVVVAPTGVAAINAGGVTIHSMFQLPLTAFVPDSAFVDLNIATNRHGLAKHTRYNKDKRKLLRELELLIIDEISMVRCDMLDAIDFLLRRTRGIDQPFGGVQVLVVGDLFQLAPVVKDHVWQVLQPYYTHPYFYDAHAWKQATAVTIELTHIYRQNEQEFVDILNRVRNNTLIPADLQRLHQNYKPNFEATDKPYITLTTHNYKADAINEKKLKSLSGKAFEFKAEIGGTFKENAYPAQQTITLKKGAQIMFIRNDPEEHRYYNGKLAEVAEVTDNHIKVSFPEKPKETLTLQKTKWDNIKYSVDKETNAIFEDNLGSFTQYPIRLAWAVTVHKSQGLTFERAIVDLGDSFAPGQAYVALSRCTSLDGLVLKSRIREQNVFIDEAIKDFHESGKPLSEMEKFLATARKLYAQEQLISVFNLWKQEEALAEWREVFYKSKLKKERDYIALCEKLNGEVKALNQTSIKFQRQLQLLFKDYGEDGNQKEIKQRCNKAIPYFTDTIFNQLIKPLHAHIEDLAYKKQVKKYLHEVQEMYLDLWLKMEQLYNASNDGVALYSSKIKHQRGDLKITETASTSAKAKKGSTYDDTLALFKQGKSIEEIAEIRGMSPKTIEGHIARWIEKGEVHLEDVIKIKRIEKILHYFDKSEDWSLSTIKESIPFDTTYSELRMLRAHAIFSNRDSVHS